MDNPNYYAIIPAKVRYDDRLRANEKLLYGEISALSNKDGECWASNSYFAKVYQVTTPAISKWISDLEECGYISVEYIRKNGSKELEKRIIHLNEVLTNVNGGINKKLRGYSQKFKENNTSINNKKEEERNFQKELKDVIEFYENNITLITAFISEDMENYLKSGLYADLIIEAMKEAVSRNKRNWKYVTGILNDCINNKVYTVKQFKIRQEEFKSNKTQTHQSNKTKEKIEYKEVELTEEQYNKMMNERGKKYEWWRNRKSSIILYHFQKWTIWFIRKRFHKSMQ